MTKISVCLIALLLFPGEAFIRLRSHSSVRPPMKPPPLLRQDAVPIISDDLLEASISTTEAIEAEDLESARSLLSSLTAEGRSGAYSLAISDYFVSSASMTVWDLSILKMFAKLLLEVNGKQPLGDSDVLGAAHAASVAIYAENKQIAEEDLNSMSKTDFDEMLRVGGAMMHCFECCYPESVWDPSNLPDIGMSPVDFFYQSSFEAVSVAKLLNCVDTSIRRSNSALSARTQLQDHFEGFLQDAAKTQDGDAFLELLDLTSEAGWVAAVELLRVSDEDAFPVLRSAGRKVLEEMLEKACNLLVSDLKDSSKNPELETTKDGFGAAMPFTDRLLALAKLWIELAAPLDYVNYERELAGAMADRRVMEESGGLDIDDNDNDDEDDEGRRSFSGSLPSSASPPSAVMGEYHFKSDAELATAHLRILALGNQARPALYKHYIRYYAQTCISADLDLADLSLDPHLIMCLTSINEYDAADINAKAYTDATTERCLALLLSHPDDDDDDDESSHEVFKSNLAPLAQNLGLTPAKALECKESALKQVVKTFLMQQQEKPSSSTADLVRRAGEFLGLDSSEFTEDSTRDGSGAVATDATTAEKLRRFSGEVDTIVSKFVDDTSPRATAAAELESAVKLFGVWRGTEAVETVVEVVAGKAVKAAKSALQFEEKNDMLNAKIQLELMAKLPTVLNGVVIVSSDSAVGVTKSDGVIAGALRTALSEEDEKRLSDICWELEDSKEQENEALARGILTAMGLR